MKALLDTCIVVDLLQRREPFFDAAHNLFLCIANHHCDGFITAKSLTDIYYLMHRFTHNDREARKVLHNLLQLVSIVSTEGSDCRKALASDVSDYEDAVMIETALREKMDCIITRNLSDYTQSPVSVYSPDQFLQILSKTPEPTVL